MPYIFEEDDSAPGEIGYDLRIPEDWEHLDLSPEGLRQRQAEILRQMSGADPERIRILNNTFNDWFTSQHTAEQVGLINAAGAFHRYEDGIFMATVSVFRFEQEPGTRFDPMEMIRLMHPPERMAEADDHLETGVIDIEGLGLCTRAQGIVTHQHDEITVRAVVAHTFAKVTGTRYWLMISCNSPVSAEADAVLDLFDAITGTLRIWSR
ncbi:hypothetical protein [Nocardiopsis valliformis]|uniref:hypothetical protein n=1 Tax=Nocardiopsis valliformis TaxID=239974 RepID=UPI000348639F|nr:hypothetical protein [Nocardiopsis valliformis]